MARVAVGADVVVDRVAGAEGELVVQRQERSALGGERSDTRVTGLARVLQRAQRDGDQRGRVRAMLEVVELTVIDALTADFEAAAIERDQDTRVFLVRPVEAA